MTLTVLLTGFGPFPTAPVNPTGLLVQRLAARRRPSLVSVRCIAHVFRTSYAAVDKELPALMARQRPDVMLMFGLATRTPHLRIETRARNMQTPLLSDVEGSARAKGPIRPRGAAVLTGRAPFQDLLVAIRGARVRAALSHSAGAYVCNYLYWRALEAQSAAHVPLVVFVHVPKPVEGKRRREIAQKRRLTFDDLVRAGEIILATAVSYARKRR